MFPEKCQATNFYYPCHCTVPAAAVSAGTFSVLVLIIMMLIGWFMEMKEN